MFIAVKWHDAHHQVDTCGIYHDQTLIWSTPRCEIAQYLSSRDIDLFDGNFSNSAVDGEARSVFANINFVNGFYSTPYRSRVYKWKLCPSVCPSVITSYSFPQTLSSRNLPQSTSVSHGIQCPPSMSPMPANQLVPLLSQLDPNEQDHIIFTWTTIHLIGEFTYYVSRRPPAKSWQLLTMGCVGLKIFHQRDFMWTKMWIEREIYLDFTIHDIKAKPYNMQIGP